LAALKATGAAVPARAPNVDREHGVFRALRLTCVHSKRLCPRSPRMRREQPRAESSRRMDRSIRALPPIDPEAETALAE
jgi:hypothetical protein